MHRNQSVDPHRFAMIPAAEIPRSSFNIQKTYKTTFDAGFLIPIYVDEILPGDSFNLRMTAFCRLATPLFPIMDNLYLDSFFFFVPNRLVWTHWVNFMGQQANPGDSISYVIPQLVSNPGGYTPLTLPDYMGIPTAGQTGAGNVVSVNALPFRAYSLIYDTWFRDENLINGPGLLTGDGPDAPGFYPVFRRGKRHDYFTSCLPWPQKGNTAITLPLGTTAPVKTNFVNQVTGVQAPLQFLNTTGAALGGLKALNTRTAGGILNESTTVTVAGAADMYPSNLYADLSSATAATINQLRQSFQIQKLLERDARGGTRYTEIVRSHFGVVSPDARLQRPEYLGGGSVPIVINPVAQTSASNLTGGTSPLGALAAMGTSLAHNHGFSASFTEHGYIIGIVNVRADMTYQQGLRKLWSRSTRYDFYFPAFAMLGEQAVLNKEIYYQADQAGANQDAGVFGYQERWAEYRYNPSQITGIFNSKYPTPIDGWHLAQNFLTLPTLGQTFIEETPPVSRVVAVGAAANGQQFIMDTFFNIKAARPLPMYSVPGLIDHF